MAAVNSVRTTGNCNNATPETLFAQTCSSLYAERLGPAGGRESVGGCSTCTGEPSNAFRRFQASAMIGFSRAMYCLDEMGLIGELAVEGL
jgi:hypothetical protein